MHVIPRTCDDHDDDDDDDDDVFGNSSRSSDREEALRDDRSCQVRLHSRTTR